MEWTDTALVLKVGRFRERDLWIRLLTKNRGIVSAFAFGASHSKRRFCGCLDLLNTIQVRAKNSRRGDFLNLEEGILLSGPRRLRQDWQRMGMFMNCTSFLEAIGINTDGGKQAFDITKQIFELLEQEEHIPDNLPILYRLRIASDQGYVTDFSVCAQCGKSLLPNLAFFNMADGHLTCKDCTVLQPNAIKLSETVLALLVSVQKLPPIAWNEFKPDRDESRECNRFIDGFIEFHLGIRWDRGRFRK